MQCRLAALAFGLGASASAIPRTCMFSLSATGPQSGPIGQLDDGQNRVGGNLPKGSYSISTGQITDAQGRGCILTPPTTQLQCDVGATPTGGFSIGGDGQVYHDGDATFYACPADDSEYNIYTQPVDGQDKCVKVGLSASGCYATATPPKPVVVQAPPPTDNNKSGKSCPANLGGEYQYPHLIVPVSKSQPDKAYGTSYNGKVTSDISTIFNFDIPGSYSSKTCSLVFLFPEQKDLQTSSFTFNGDGVVDCKQLKNVATQQTSRSSQGDTKTEYGHFTIKPGTETVIATFACPAGQAVSYEMGAISGTSLDYFQDYNPSPIGMYVTAC